MWALMGQADVVVAARQDEVGLARVELDIYLFLKLFDHVLRTHDVAQEHWCRMHGMSEGAWRSVGHQLPASGKLGLENRRPASLAAKLNL
jgi:hypothetical protein